MWIIVNIANSRWDTPSSVDVCETEEVADELCAWLNNCYGGSSDFSFVVVKGRKWATIPEVFDPFENGCKVYMDENGDFQVEKHEMNTRESDNLKLPEDERFLDNTWNYHEDVVEELKDKGVVVSSYGPYLYGTPGPYVSIVVYSDVALGKEDLDNLLGPHIEKAKQALRDKYEVAELLPIPAPPTKGWKVKEDA